MDHKTTSAPRKAQSRLSHEVKAKALCANSEATIIPLTSSTLLGSARTAACGSTKALSAQIASSCAANSTLYRVQPHLSHEAKNKALCVNSEAITASLASTTLLGSAKPAARETKAKTPLVLIESLISVAPIYKHQVLKISAARLEIKHHWVLTARLF